MGKVFGRTGRGGIEGGEVEGMLSSSVAKEMTGNGMGDGGGALGKCAEGCGRGGASKGGPVHSDCHYSSLTCRLSNPGRHQAALNLASTALACNEPRDTGCQA